MKPNVEILLLVLLLASCAVETGGSSGKLMQGNGFSRSHRNMRVIKDSSAGYSLVNGGNTIVVEDAHGRIDLHYAYSPGHYLMLGNGDLTGRPVDVFFSNGAPVSIRSSYGQGVVNVVSYTMASNATANKYQGSPEDRFHSAYMGKDYAAAIQMIRNREITPNSMIATKTIRNGELELRLFVFNEKADELPSQNRDNNYAGVIDAILKSDFPERESFEDSVAGMGLGGRLDVLEVALDNGVRMKGRSWRNLIIPSSPNANAFLGSSCYGFSDYTDEKKRRLGTLVARVEKAGGGSFDDFDAGIRRRNEWVQSVREVINGGVLFAAYVVAGGAIHVGDAVTTGVKDTLREGFSAPPVIRATPAERQAVVRGKYTGSDTRDFQVTGVGNGVANHELELKDVKDGFRIWVRYHGATGIFAGDRLKGDSRTLVGSIVNVKFTDAGVPASVARNHSGAGLCEIRDYSGL